MTTNHFLEMYAILYGITLLHELSHVLAAKLIGLTIKEIRIGDELFSLRMGKLRISPNCMWGSGVVFDGEELKNKAAHKVVAFYMSGSVVNLLLIAVAFCFRGYSTLYTDILIWSNVYNLAMNLCPFLIPSNDMNCMLRRIRKREMKSKENA